MCPSPVRVRCTRSDCLTQVHVHGAQLSYNSFAEFHTLPHYGSRADRGPSTSCLQITSLYFISTTFNQINRTSFCVVFLPYRQKFTYYSRTYFQMYDTSRSPVWFLFSQVLRGLRLNPSIFILVVTELLVYLVDTVPSRGRGLTSILLTSW